MIVRGDNGRAVREPGANPGRSRRCKGRCPPPDATEQHAREGGGGGAPSQKTCRSPSIPIPSRKEESWPSASFSCRSCSSCCPRPRSQRQSRCASKARRRRCSPRPRSTVTAANAQDALEQASLAGEFYYHVTVTGFGPYVDQVGRYGGTASQRLGVQGQRHLAARRRRQGRAEGRRSRALVLRDVRAARAGRRRCRSRRRRRGATSAQAFDDNGKAATRRPASSSTSARSARSRRNQNVDVCPGPHPGVLVRATATGAVRSNAVK